LHRSPFVLSPQSSVLSPDEGPRLGSVSVACASSTLWHAIASPGSGTVDVTVTAFGLQSAVSAGDQFLDALTPAVGAVAPRAGPTSGGRSVTITGSGFLNATGVSFGGAAASFSVNSDASVAATPPGGAAGSVVDVQVTTAAGTSSTCAADSFTYVFPGDANAYGVVDATDALCILRAVAVLPGDSGVPDILSAPTAAYRSSSAFRAARVAFCSSERVGAGFKPAPTSHL
jgi:hypothetical protein